MQKEFAQVDAFSARPLYGNPAAVVFDADDIQLFLQRATESISSIAYRRSPS